MLKEGNLICFAYKTMFIYQYNRIAELCQFVLLMNTITTPKQPPNQKRVANYDYPFLLSLQCRHSKGGLNRPLTSVLRSQSFQQLPCLSQGLLDRLSRGSPGRFKEPGSGRSPHS